MTTDARLRLLNVMTARHIGQDRLATVLLDGCTIDELREMVTVATELLHGQVQPITGLTYTAALVEVLLHDVGAQAAVLEEIETKPKDAPVLDQLE